ncbi:MAG: carboxymuconolactone decarboxylase family protein [Lautropia sp.]|nr:carboxymuconolactone decarboxylase family protein [Lautropia sp.]
MNRSLLTAAALGVASTAPALADEMTINRAETLKYVDAPQAHFTGKARFAPYPAIPGSTDRSAIVEFSLGVINNWHTHTHGQYLIITEGVGRVQVWGQPIRTVRKGDVVWFPPDVKHWHGAAEDSTMSHIAIAPRGEQNKTTWLERVDLPAAATAKPAAPAAGRAGSLPPIHLSEAEKQKHVQTTPLTERQLAIVPIAGLSATGDLERLKPAIAQGLDKGLTVSEVREIFAHQHAYAGFPRALNGIITLQTVLKERAAAGVRDEAGQDAAPLTNPDYYRLGRETLLTMGNDKAANSVLFDFPGIDHALKAHLFGYLFHRDNLAFVDRQLVTVSTLAALGNVEPQLTSHLKNTQHLGVRTADLGRVFDVLEKDVNPGMAVNARRLLQKR